MPLVKNMSKPEKNTILAFVCNTISAADWLFAHPDWRLIAS